MEQAIQDGELAQAIREGMRSALNSPTEELRFGFAAVIGLVGTKFPELGNELRDFQIAVLRATKKYYETPVARE